MKKLLSFVTTALLCVNIVSSAGAVTVEVTVEGTVVGGTFDGTTGSGTLTYDDTALNPVGIDVLSWLDGGLTLDFTIFGQTFHATDDANFPTGPTLEFVNGEIDIFDWTVDENFGANLTSITMPGVFGFFMFDVLESTGTGAETIISGNIVVDEIGTVPLPAALPLFIASFGLLGWFARRSP